MPILVTCPTCGANARAPDGLAGAVKKCPKCGTLLRVPSAGVAVQASPAAPAASRSTPPTDRPHRNDNRAAAGAKDRGLPTKTGMMGLPPLWLGIGGTGAGIVLLCCVGCIAFLLTRPATTAGDGKATGGTAERVIAENKPSQEAEQAAKEKARREAEVEKEKANAEAAHREAKAEQEAREKAEREAREKAEREAREQARPSISYRIVREWSIPNGGYGREVVIDPVHRNEKDMKALGDQFRQDTKNDRNAFITVYDDEKACACEKTP